MVRQKYRHFNNADDFFSGYDKISAFVMKNIFFICQQTERSDKISAFIGCRQNKIPGETIALFFIIISSLNDECCQVLIKYRHFSRKIVSLLAEKKDGPTKI